MVVVGLVRVGGPGARGRERHEGERQRGEAEEEARHAPKVRRRAAMRNPRADRGQRWQRRMHLRISTISALVSSMESVAMCAASSVVERAQATRSRQ